MVLAALFFEIIDFCSLLSDDDPGAGRMNRHLRLLRFTGHSLDFDFSDARVIELFLQVVPNAKIFDEEPRIILTRIPPRIPGLDITQSKTNRMYFLSQGLSSLISHPGR